MADANEVVTLLCEYALAGDLEAVSVFRSVFGGFGIGANLDNSAVREARLNLREHLAILRPALKPSGVHFLVCHVLIMTQ